jgi:hypothetical protein
MASYVAEVAIKLLGVALYAGLKEKARDQAYRMAYELVRADGLGTWETWIRQATTQPLAGFLPVSFNELVAWTTKIRTRPDDDWFRQASASIGIVFGELGLDSPIPERKPAARDLIAALVQLRNKTKAHGAVGGDFFLAINSAYIEAIRLLLVECPLFSWRWLHLLTRESKKNRGIWLQGTDPSHAREAEIAPLTVTSPGVHAWPTHSIHPISCADLLASDRECTKFLLPNGGAASQQAWFIDYASGTTTQRDITPFLRPPAPLPPSDTEGLAGLDIQSNVFGNLPSVLAGYVRRPELEAELERRLRDRNHAIVTLHGRGGIGKTSLGLHVAHALAIEADPLFEHLVWFSARDIDLRPSGPKDVRPAVVNLEAVSKLYGNLFEVPGTPEGFAEILRNPSPHSSRGILFIFDNFETMEGLRELQEFLDTHTHLPNKVLITSRERAFKADFPIEVRGMAKAEATELMLLAGRELGIETLITPGVIDGVYEYSEGHPYVIRVVIGEIAKEGRYVPPKSLLPRRLDIVNAVFERSFNKLSDAGRRVFLTVACWKSLVSEVALLVVLGYRGLDAEAGLDECLRLSLLERRYFLDDQPAYSAPQVARLFAKKKLEGDPDRLLIQEDLATLQKFGVLPTAQPVQIPQHEVISKFVTTCLTEVSSDEEDRGRIDGILERLAEIWPDAWIPLARFRSKSGAPSAETEYALRRAVEERPSSKEAHLQRAAFARSVGDESTFIASRLRAVEVDPTDHLLVREVAFDVCKYVNDHTTEIPVARRGVYLANLREQMRQLTDSLDATGLSRLAWLYLLEENKAEAWRYAKLGLSREPDNRHCQNIVERLRLQGFSG